MTATVYRDPNFQGPFARILPGTYSGRDLRGFRSQSAYSSGEDLDNEISSIRIGPNAIVVLYVGQTQSASSGARVLIGPTDISDLGALGIDDSVSALKLVGYKPYNSGIARFDGATLYSDYDGGGRYARLPQGDFNAARLASEEIRFSSRLRSIRVAPHTIAVLYEGPDFDATQDAVAIVGPSFVRDLDSIGMADRVASIQVIHADPGDSAGPAFLVGNPLNPPDPRLAYTEPFPPPSPLHPPLAPAPRAEAPRSEPPPPSDSKPAQQSTARNPKAFVLLFILFIIFILLTVNFLRIQKQDIVELIKSEK